MKRTVIGTVVLLALVVSALGLASYADESNGTGGYQVDPMQQESKCEVVIYPVDENVPDDPDKKLSRTLSSQSSLEESSKVSLPEAARIAADAVSGEAVEAELEEEDGQVFYSVKVATNNGLIDVIVDPTGNVLFCGQDSKKKDKDNRQKNKRATKDGDDDDCDDDNDND